MITLLLGDTVKYSIGITAGRLYENMHLFIEWAICGEAGSQLCEFTSVNMFKNRIDNSFRDLGYI